MDSDIGSNLRGLRAQRGISLRELSAQSGLSPALLSQLERGIAQPSLKTLRALSGVFGESASSLFASDSLLLLHHSRPGARSRISSPLGRIQYERLTPNNGQVEVLRGTLQSGDWSSDEPWSHRAIECAYVESGALTVEIGGRTLLLAAGEAVTFDSQQAHRYGNESARTTTFILSVSPPTP